MLFSLTREVGWEADDEDDDPNLGAGVRKRYRFVFDFSRRGRKTRDKNSKKAVLLSDAEALGDHSDFEEDDDDIGVDVHTCFGCGHVRSNRYHQKHPFRIGEIPRDNLCTQCRHYRKVRLTLRARDGGRRRRVSHSEARIDHREWCTSCGILRSTKYHDKLFSGRSFGLSEVCRYCIRSEVKGNGCEAAQMYLEGLDVEEWDKTEKHDPLRDSLRHRRSSPYTLTPTSPSFHEEVIIVSTATSASDLTVETDQSTNLPQRRSSPYAFTPTSPSFRKEVGNVSTTTSPSKLTAKTNQSSKTTPDKQAPVTATVPEHRTVPSINNLSERSRVQPITKKDNVERDVSDKSQKSVQTDCQQSQGFPEPQQQEKSRLLDEHLKRTQRPEKPCPAPNCTKADNVKQHQEARERDRPLHGQGKGQSKSSIESRQPEVQEPFYFRNPHPVPKAEKPSDSQDRHAERKVAEPFYFQNPIPTNKARQQEKAQKQHKKASQQPRPQPKPRRQQQQQQQQQQQEPKPIGIADMYWASQKGMAEQAFTAAGGFFFPSGAFASASTSRHRQEDEAKHPFRPSSTGHSGSSATSHGGSSTSTSTGTGTSTGTSTSHAWEVDSDEAEEIEQSRARLVAAQSEGKGGRAGKTCKA